MQIEYMSWLKNRTGVSKETISLPDGVKTVEQFLYWLSNKGKGYAFLAENISIIKVAINGQVVDGLSEYAVRDDDKVSIFSPLAGG